ncbi:MAG: universal stress protein [Xanthomonadales bacterium]|nr:universal stress protein [Xanthomonadales bacterium]
MQFNRILSVLNTTAEDQIARQRAAFLAARTGTELKLQAVVYEPHHAEPIFHERDERCEAERSKRLDAITYWLQDQAMRCDGADVKVEASWGHPFDRAVLDAVAEYQPDLLVIQPRNLDSRKLSTAEWHLLRQAPCPVWLARGPQWTSNQKNLIAAVDPTHGHNKPAALDREIIDAAETIASALGVRYRLVHAIGKIPGTIGAAQHPMDYERELREIRRRHIEDLLGEESLGDIEILVNEPGEALGLLCNEDQAHLVIMGIIARSRIADLLVGTTARHFIPESRCDILLIKPPKQ